MKSAIVIGGNGFIGRYLVMELLENGYEVTIVMRNSTVKKLDGVKVIYCDLADIDSIKLQNQYDICFYLAWNGVVPEKKNDVELQLTNIKYAIDAMRFANRCGCKRFVATGSVAEYVMGNHTIDIHKKQTPNDFYGAVKTGLYYMLTVLSKQIGIDLVWCILASTYGPGRKGDNIITYTIETLLNGQVPVYGKLEQLWDFLYVADAAKGIRLCAECEAENPIYGIGSGIYKPLKDYICMIRNVIDPDLELGIGKQKEMTNKSVSSCVDIYDLVKNTGFSTEFTFEEGIAVTIEDIKKNQKAKEKEQ